MVNLNHTLLVLFATLAHRNVTAMEHNDNDTTEEAWPSEQGDDHQWGDRQWSSNWNGGWNQWWHSHWNWGWQEQTQPETAETQALGSRDNTRDRQRSTPRGSRVTRTGTDRANAQQPRSHSTAAAAAPAANLLTHIAQRGKEWAWHRPQPESSPSHAVRHRPWWDTHPIDQGEPAQPQALDTTTADRRVCQTATRKTSRQNSSESTPQDSKQPSEPKR